MMSLAFEQNCTKRFAYFITVCTGVFILFVLYKALSPGLLDSILPRRFSHPVSLALLMSSALICALAAIGAAGRIRVREHLRNWQVALLFFFAAALLPLPLVFCSNIQPRWDFDTYYKLADALSQGGVLISDYVAAFPHTIGFPAVLSVLFNLFGTSVLAAQLAGVFFSALSVSLVYIAGLRIVGRRYGFWAAALWLLMPSRILYTLLICTENLFNAWAILTVLLFIRAVQARRRGAALLLFGSAGIGFSILSAVRPNGLILLFACILVYWIFTPKDDRLHAGRVPAMKAACCFSAVALFFLTSFFINQAIEVKIGREVASTRIGWNLYVGMNGQSNGTWNQEDSELFSALLSEKGPESAQRAFLQLGYARMEKQLKAGTFPSFILKKMGAMWYVDHEAFNYLTASQDGDSDKPIQFQQGNKVIELVCDGYYYMLLLLSLFACAVRIKNGSFEILPLLACLVLLGIVAFHIPFETALRYKNHGMLWLCFLGADGALCSAGGGVLFKKKEQG